VTVTQAVILAGGRGTRLGALTDNCPKPMIQFHGKPFLAYLIEYLRKQGFTKILLLLGYLPDIIHDYFGDGTGFGVQIKYSISHLHDDTGRRLYLAGNKINPSFLLTYSDNYCAMNLDSVKAQFEQDYIPCMTVHTGAHRNNIEIDRDGYVIDYDPSREKALSSGLDIGFTFLNRDIIDKDLRHGNANFERIVYPKLINSRMLKANIVTEPYYSIGSPERLVRTSQFLAHIGG